jgi:hypothetical protein
MKTKNKEIEMYENEELIGLYREEDETWYEAGMRCSGGIDLERSFDTYYYDLIRDGEDDFSACMIALEKLGFCLSKEDYAEDDDS